MNHPHAAHTMTRVPLTLRHVRAITSIDALSAIDRAQVFLAGKAFDGVDRSVEDRFRELPVPDEWIDRAFAVMALAPQHVFQVLTKRPERMRRYVRRASASGRFLLWRHPTLGHEIIDAAVAQWPTMFRHVWLGTSVEDQARAGRIWHLAHTPAAVRWVSAEPLLSPLDAVTAGILGTDADGKPAVDWIVVGGESGPSHRPMNPDWARALRDQCAGKVAFFMKQMAGKGPIPPDLMVREWPRMTPGIRARGR